MDAHGIKVQLRRGLVKPLAHSRAPVAPGGAATTSAAEESILFAPPPEAQPAAPRINETAGSKTRESNNGEQFKDVLKGCGPEKESTPNH
jgi:hypothetical protein